MPIFFIIMDTSIGKINAAIYKKDGTLQLNNSFSNWILL